MPPFVAQAVLIPSDHARLRQQSPGLVLDTLRTNAVCSDLGLAAHYAADIRAHFIVASMAAQSLAIRMVDERHVALGTGQDVAAGPALAEGRHAAPIEEKDCLLTRGIC